jgi:hypothetical protein
MGPIAYTYGFEPKYHINHLHLWHVYNVGFNLFTLVTGTSERLGEE